jgi:hypothetical protein
MARDALFLLGFLTQTNSVAPYVQYETLYSKEGPKSPMLSPISPHLLPVPHPGDLGVSHLWKSALYTLVGEKTLPYAGAEKCRTTHRFVSL